MRSLLQDPVKGPCIAQVAKGVIGLVVVGHYPLNHHPARLAMEDLERHFLGWHTISRSFSICQSLVFIWTSVAVAVVVSAQPET